MTASDSTDDIGDAFPGIESSPDVCGGEARIAGTRIPVWVLEQARRLGTSEADILTAYPSLQPKNLAAAWAYVQAHPEEIENDIRANEEDAAWAEKAREAAKGGFVGTEKSTDFIRKMLDSKDS